MKVALFGTLNKSDTGPSRVTEGLASGLASKGADVLILSHGDRTTHPDADVKHLGSTPNSVLGSLGIQYRAHKQASNHDVDIIHPLEEYLFPASIRTVQWTSGLLVRKRYAPRDFSYRSFAGDILLNGMNLVGSFQTNYVIASSPKTAEEMESLWGITPDETIPLGIGSESRHPPTSLNTPLKILIPGRITQKKGQIDALSNLSRDSDIYKVELVGSVSDSAYYQELGEWQDRHHGFVTREALEQLYIESDIVIIPSKHENFSLTALEGMAHGCAVIATDMCGITRFDWAHRENGLISVGNGEDIEKELMGLIRKQAISRMKQSAYEMTADLTWEQISKKYLEIYNQHIQ